MIAIGLTGCAKAYPEYIADKQDPMKIGLTPSLRKLMAIAVIKRNSLIVFSKAEISNPKSTGIYPSAIDSSQKICVRWEGTNTRTGVKVVKYTESQFHNGRPIGSQEFSFDACSFLAFQAKYEPLPELLTIQASMRKFGLAP